MRNVKMFEKGLGVDIETFLRIIADGFHYVKNNEIYWCDDAVFIGIGYCARNNFMVRTHHLYRRYDDNDKIIEDCHYWNWKNKEDIFSFKDYGKTWSANREDLKVEVEDE